MAWTGLGSKSLVLNDWVRYPDVRNTETFRLTPGNLQGYRFFKSYALVRMAWDSDGEPNYTPTRRIYPRQDPIVMDFRLPVDIKESGTPLIWHLEAMKVVYRRWIGRSNEPSWTLSLDAWETAPALVASWAITSTWDTGWSGEITLTNTSSVPISDWQLSFESGNITETFGVELEAVDADTWQATPSITAGTNAILPGRSVTFGFVGAGEPNLNNLQVISLAT